MGTFYRYDDPFDPAYRARQAAPQNPAKLTPGHEQFAKELADKVIQRAARKDGDD